MTEEVKRCPTCGESKPLAGFCRNRKSKDGHAYECRTCHAKRHNEWNRIDRLRRAAAPEADKVEWRKKKSATARACYAKKPEHYREASRVSARNNPERRLATQRKYQMGEDGVAIFASQGGKCAICGSGVLYSGGKGAERSTLDHCHETGVVRGILCHNCNVGLGNFLDDPARLRKAADYLEQFEVFK